MWIVISQRTRLPDDYLRNIVALVYIIFLLVHLINENNYQLQTNVHGE
ncbi:hypothetical protein SPRA44_370007 [Serratia proteamaculans]|nr:hypothetical protein SPRA44_370007 [Serratia proteamaculans]